MRLIFGMTGFLVVMALADALAKKQLGAKPTSQSISFASQTAAAPYSKYFQLLSQRVQQQLKQSADAALQQEKVADSQ